MSEGRDLSKEAPSMSASKDESCNNDTANSTQPTSLESAAKKPARSAQEASSHSVQQRSEGTAAGTFGHDT